MKKTHAEIADHPPNSVVQNGNSLESTERWSIRVVVVILFVASVIFALVLDVPLGVDGKPDLPAVALDRELLYRLEVLLVAVYGGLLLLTPLFYGAVRGRLPIEVSARGARFSEAAEDAVSRAEAAIQRLQADSSALKAEVVELQIKERRRGS